MNTGFDHGTAHYHCEDCDVTWKAAWSTYYGHSTYDDDNATDECPNCGTPGIETDEPYSCRCSGDLCTC